MYPHTQPIQIHRDTQARRPTFKSLYSQIVASTKDNIYFPILIIVDVDVEVK